MSSNMSSVKNYKIYSNEEVNKIVDFYVDNLAKLFADKLTVSDVKKMFDESLNEKETRDVINDKSAVVDDEKCVCKHALKDNKLCNKRVSVYSENKDRCPAHLNNEKMYCDYKYSKTTKKYKKNQVCGVIISKNSTHLCHKHLKSDNKTKAKKTVIKTSTDNNKIFKNKFGNLADPKGIVLNSDKFAYGKQNEDGSVTKFSEENKEETKDLIEYCKTKHYKILIDGKELKYNVKKEEKKDEKVVDDEKKESVKDEKKTEKKDEKKKEKDEKKEDKKDKKKK